MELFSQIENSTVCNKLRLDDTFIHDGPESQTKRVNQLNQSKSTGGLESSPTLRTPHLKKCQTQAELVYRKD